LIIEISGFDGEPIYMPERPNEVKYAWCSADKARKLLGYKTTVSLREGLTKMWEWAKSVGAQKLRYWDEFEIKTDKIPEVWAKKLL
jgi:UDP-glucose 4-epimerase